MLLWLISYRALCRCHRINVLSLDFHVLVGYCLRVLSALPVLLSRLLAVREPWLFAIAHSMNGCTLYCGTCAVRDSICAYAGWHLCSA